MRHAYDMDHGARILPDGRTRFRVWAPSVADMRISLEDGPPLPMRREPGDWFSVELPAAAGTRYRYVLPDGMRVSDPGSRLQDGDVHDASVVVDPRAYDWRHDNPPRPFTDTVLYEVHPGAMGGYAGIERRLEFLRDLGITAIELMPLSDFPGRHNWGYDGVLPYAPDTAYGTTDELKHLIDTAHGLGLMVFLDVVYNHFGPDGAYIHIYAKSFFTEEFHTPWGAGIDFRRTVVQEYFIDNALYWLREYRFDGLRFDAVSRIEPAEFLFQLASGIRRGVEPGRQVHLMMEHELNAAALLRGSFDAQWTDDVHHALHVLLTGETFGYYEDFADATALLMTSLRYGFCYQGEMSRHMRHRRGESAADLPTSRFLIFAQNHDQIGNRAIGDRLTTIADPAAVRAARAFVLLAPFIPMLFMGEEWATRRPFLFFTDHADPALARGVREGRRREFSAFFGDKTDDIVPDPNSHKTFAASCLDYAEADQDGYRQELLLTRHLLGLRHAHLTGRITRVFSTGASVLAPGAVLGSWRLDDGAELRLALNLGADPARLDPTDLPLLFASSAEAGARARGGTLPGYGIAVFLSGLAHDAPPGPDFPSPAFDHD